MKKYISTSLLAIVSILLVTQFSVAENDGLPEKQDKFVYDYLGVLTKQQVQLLEKKMRAFSDTTSNQISILITKELNGLEIAQYADMIGDKWGVGQKDKSNGVVIVVKPVGAAGQRKAHIAVGYGLESVIPDAIAKRIVETEMIPNFKKKNFYQGLNRGTDVIMKLASGEYSTKAYLKKTTRSRWAKVIPVIVILIAFLLMRVSRAMTYSAGKSVPFWTAIWLMSSGGGHGSWGDFSSGDGGFSGFGGGSFGGGGAGGSW